MASGGERGNAYSAPDPCAESLDKMTKRLTADLRVKVRRLAHHEPLSPEWLEMADTLQHLASVAMMEEKDGAKKEGSIWERDELCVRYIIEEGKINMLARTMREFKEWQYKAEKEGLKLDDDSRLRVKVFEQSLGTLLKYAFTAVESLQTLDLTTLTEHVAIVLKHSLGDFSAPVGEHTIQELLVVQYLDLLFRHIEQLNEETVMKLVEQHEIVPLVLKQFEKLHNTMDKDTQEATAFFLAHLFETEYYSTHKAKIFADPTDKKRLVALEGLAKELVAQDPEKKKTLRALQDNIIRYK